MNPLMNPRTLGVLRAWSRVEHVARHDTCIAKRYFMQAAFPRPFTPLIELETWHPVAAWAHAPRCCAPAPFRAARPRRGCDTAGGACALQRA